VSKLFIEDEVEKLIEKAYNNGITEADIARSRSGNISDAKDYKNSTAYYKFKINVTRCDRQKKFKSKYKIGDTVYFFKKGILMGSNIVAVRFLEDTFSQSNVHDYIQYFVFGFWIEEKYLYKSIKESLSSSESIYTPCS